MPQSNHRILIVDDEEGIRESFRLILADHYQIEFATNADEALASLERGAPSLMLLDIKMPRTNGLELLKQVKKLRPALPVVIVTGYQSVETAQEAIRNGATDYIPKPFDSKQILECVNSLLGHK